ncbi:MAG TPA: hypothetical protein VFN52_06485, partial [Acidiferrobacteraceae bacterium]|nr:hypothetical protein [Acidiferrobacteraceae bacterium]
TNGVLASTPLSSTTAVPGSQPFAVVVGPAGHFLYVTNEGNGTVASYAISNGIIAPTPTRTTTTVSGSGPLWVALAP